MKQYILAGLLTLSLVLLIAGTTYLTLETLNLGKISILSISDMQAQNADLEKANVELNKSKSQFNLANSNLENAKNEYIKAKDEYNNISDEKIERIKEETKEEHYYVDWLWIVLGEYAVDNKLEMQVIEPRAGNDSDKSANGTMKIKLLGRYSDITNFVFEVENDNALKFKLDNMLMEYGADNKVSATFDVLSMEVLF